MVRHIAALITEGLENVLSVLRFVQATSDVFPPLKSAVSAVIWITDSVKDFKSNQEDWKQFSDYVQQIVVCIICLVRKHERSVEGPQMDLLQQSGEFLRCDSQYYNSALVSLSKTLEEIRTIMAHRQEVVSKSPFRLYITSAKDRTEINELRSKLDRALALFQLGSTIEARNEIAKDIDFLADELRNLSDQVRQSSQILERSTHLRNLQTIQDDEQKNISRLGGADIAPWDLKGTCLDGTRVDIVNDILGFADGSNPSYHDSIRVLLITGVAGSGKSTIAETVRQQCQEAGLVRVSSFNFVTGSAQKTPDLLIKTIVRDLIRFIPDFPAKISASIEHNPSIISASIAEQFRYLIQKPLSSVSIPQRVVFIIDALDEGYDENLIDILSNKCSSLPNCRFIITTRPFPNILYAFQVDKNAEIESRTVELLQLELDNERNHDDIAVFARHELRKFGLKSWPDESDIQALVKEAGGLFIWVVTVCDYIQKCSPHPPTLLRRIIEDHSSNLPSEAKLEKLYSTVLSNCPWNEPDFEDMYQKLLGTVIALRSPLQAIAIKSLLQMDPTVDLSVCLRWLSPVLTGLKSYKGMREPLQTLHPSFRRYVTQPQHKFSGDEIKFAIDEVMHSQHLALHSLRVMNEELPKLVQPIHLLVSDELWYSCRFWISHLETVEKPSEALLVSLTEFLKSLIPWMKICVEKQNFTGIGRIISWAQGVDFPIWKHLDPVAEVVSSYLYHLAFFFREVGRWEESLTAIDGAIILHRRLATNQPADFNRLLGRSLVQLSTAQIKLGRRELGTALEAVDLCRALSKEQPSYTRELSTILHNVAFIHSLRRQWEEALIVIQEAVDLRRKLSDDLLAASLNSLAWYLHHLNRDGDALQYTLEAVTLQRKIAGDPDSFLTLASHLETLSRCLSGVSRHEEALNVICEAEFILIQQCKPVDHPTEDYTCTLALILDKKSACLACCDQYEDADNTIHKAVKLRRQLARNRPAYYNPELAESLLHLAKRLADMGDHEQGLPYTREAVGLWRELAEDEPTSFGDDFAKSLECLALGLLAVGLDDEAADAQQEAKKVRDLLQAKV